MFIIRVKQSLPAKTEDVAQVGIIKSSPKEKCYGTTVLTPNVSMLLQSLDAVYSGKHLTE